MQVADQQLVLFPMKSDSMTGFKEILKRYGVTQRSILFKSYVFAAAFEDDYFEFEQFLKQVTSSYSYKKLENNKPRQQAWLSSVLYNELRAIEEAIKTDTMGLVTA